LIHQELIDAKGTFASRLGQLDEQLAELLKELSATSSRGRLAERSAAGETGEVKRSCIA
jgi:hypothetical protein